MFLSFSLISKAGTLCTPFRCSFRLVCKFFFNHSSFNPLATHSFLNSSTVMSLKGLIPPFLLLLPAGPERTILHRSSRDRCGFLKLYVRSLYLRESPLQELQPLFPPLCSPLSNCCSGSSQWKKHFTSCTGDPFLVATLSCSCSKLSFCLLVMHQSIRPVPSPPPVYYGAFVCLVSPKGGAFAKLTLPRGWAFVNPGAIAKLLTRTRFPIRI